ncbi:hypothetical protein RD110_13790 [Rhodoferax koreense]|uniref:DUF2486 domain-containing protein n=1 Tax=Rhodoferax koreensis TaxID=1842727 RepID=A0A1P8JWK7_9BURK|nr:hypothetical protein [Rhodoferax koreense]APW38135.1 hypothetical protein RD110_13790 [Rhodoferax koreense]
MQTPRTPPRFVPTLTEVVQNEPVSSPMSPPEPVAPAAFVPALSQLSAESDPTAEPKAMLDVVATETLEDQIIHRVMQRVDLSLEQRLQQAVSAMVLAQTQLLVPRLREEIEFVVRQSVSDAVADELATRNPR